MGNLVIQSQVVALALDEQMVERNLSLSGRLVDSLPQVLNLLLLAF